MKSGKTESKEDQYWIPLHYPFCLPGEVLGREIPFMSGLELTERWKRDLQGGDETLKLDCERERKDARAVMKTLLDLIRGNVSADEASAQLQSAGKPGQGWVDPAQIEVRLRETPEIRQLLQHLLQFGELRLATLDKQVTDVENTLNCITALGVAALDRKDGFATERLADIANYAVIILETLAEQRPGLVRPLARKSHQWPVMASVEPDWQGTAQDRLQRLQLGEDTIHGTFEKSKAYNLEIVSRRYARGIVETLEKNRCCAALVKERMQVIKAREKKDGVKVLIQRIPAWVGKAAQLDPFGPKSAEDWLEVGIEMLKEERPELPHSPDWARIKTHWENRGDKPTPGRLWGSIKDALRSPIKTIARAHRPEKLTQKPPASLGNPNPKANKA